MNISRTAPGSVACEMPCSNQQAEGSRSDVLVLLCRWQRRSGGGHAKSLTVGQWRGPVVVSRKAGSQEWGRLCVIYLIARQGTV